MPSSDPGNARWLVVIPRDQHELYEALRESLKAGAPFRVMLERRQGERRRGDRATPSADRRRTDRRQERPVGALYVTTIVRGNGTARPTLPGGGGAVVNTACPACCALLSFELPRFPQPPARLDAEVVHASGPGGAQHFAEIQAFTISGRPLLVGRVQVFRRDAGS